MSRSRALVMAIVALSLLPAARPAAAQKQTLVDAIGAVDYLHGRSAIQVGTWVKYRITGAAAAGVTDEYTSTVLIAGEEEWWGEECFWVETHTELPGAQVISAATLMSYAIFDDSLRHPPPADLPAQADRRHRRERAARPADHAPGREPAEEPRALRPRPHVAGGHPRGGHGADPEGRLRLPGGAPGAGRQPDRREPGQHALHGDPQVPHRPGSPSTSRSRTSRARCSSPR